MTNLKKSKMFLLFLKIDKVLTIIFLKTNFNLINNNRILIKNNKLDSIFVKKQNQLWIILSIIIYLNNNHSIEIQMKNKE